MYHHRRRYGFSSRRSLGCFFYPSIALVAGILITMGQAPAWSNWVFVSVCVLLIVACVFVTKKCCY